MTTLNEVPETAMAPRLIPPGGEPGAPLERMEPLNLARRPFFNSRPVVRVSLLLWVLGVLLLAGNISLFWSYLTSSADKRQEIARGEGEIERQRRLARQLQTRLASIDLESLNAQVDFLNEKIAQRTFSWSLLLNRLTEVLPDDVRVNRLTPETDAREGRQLQRSRRAGRDPEGSIRLEMTCESRNDEALLQFVQNMFNHPSFSDPNHTREEREQNGDLLRFEISVLYIPGDRPHPVVEQVPTIEEAAPAAPLSAAGAASPLRPPDGRRGQP